MKTQRLSSLLLTLLVAGCVTINIYFPAAEAKEAAEQIVEDILKSAPARPEGQPTGPGAEPPAGEGKRPGTQGARTYRLQASLLDLLVPAARAAQPDFSVDSPEIRRIQASLKQRYPALQPHFRSGAVGLTQDGLVAVRDAGAVPLRDKARIDQLVRAENADRQRLYQAIASANGRPEWAADVQRVFAQTWIEKAESGWWYQRGGQWVRK
jgi:uncharacterized protein YdbL (DUF1318 family)